MNEESTQGIKVSPIIVSGIVTLCVSALGGAVKAFVDVENLKQQVRHTEEAQGDIKLDIREIRNDIKTILQRLPKE